ncbi:hypothetical protein BGX28_006924 [Mortierella sp. GBA30]|nr:hypothetical protein BGX28_006924 [Mortierella sp. GBA30]
MHRAIHHSRPPPDSFKLYQEQQESTRFANEMTESTGSASTRPNMTQGELMTLLGLRDTDPDPRDVFDADLDHTLVSSSVPYDSEEESDGLVDIHALSTATVADGSINKLGRQEYDHKKYVQLPRRETMRVGETGRGQS